MSLNIAVIPHEGARRYPDKIALRAGDKSLRYGELDLEARRFAGWLAAAGIERGQHVAVMIANAIEFSIAYYGCAYAGCPVVPLNVLLMPDEVAYHLEDSDAVALATHPPLADGARAGFALVAPCKELLVIDGPIEHEAVEAVPDTNPDDTAVLLYTSGTTGKPKGAELTHFNMFYNADLAARLHDMDASTVSLAVLPLFHSFGQTVIQNGTLIRGGTVVLLPRFEAGPALDAIEQHGITFFGGVPTMYFGLLHHPGSASRDLSSLRTCVSGGAPMPVEVMRAFDETHNTRIMEGYGLSETSPVASIRPPERRDKVGSIGQPIWGIEFRLIDDEGNVITEIDTPGEICIKGHNIMKGYYKRPDATAAAIQQGWFRSGDIGTRDADDFYFIVDRKKDMILRGGFNVYPREIEEVLYGHPAIAEAAVIGVPDERLGEEVKAVVSLKPDATATGDELIAYCRERMAKYKYPRVVEIIDDLPKGPTGKLLKRALR